MLTPPTLLQRNFSIADTLEASNLINLAPFPMQRLSYGDLESKGRFTK